MHVNRQFCKLALVTGVTSTLILGQSAVWQPTGATSGNIFYNGGNVGVGTGTPTARLHVHNGSAVINAGGEITAGDVPARTLLLGSRPDGYSSALGFQASSSARGSFEYGQNGTFNFWNFNSASSQWKHSMTIMSNGNVGIGVANPAHTLAVNGTVAAKDVLVTNSSWADFVFQQGYHLKPLEEVSRFIASNGHLPDVPSEAEVAKNGISVGEMQAKLLLKIEELTLYAIDQAKKQLDLETVITKQEKRNQDLRLRLERLERIHHRRTN
jgi:hypothetical protein